MAARNGFRRPNLREEKAKGKYAHINIDKATGRCTVYVRFRREDGSTFRWKRVTGNLPDALRAREEGYREWEVDRGVGREEQRAKRKDKTDDLTSWTERALPLVKSQHKPTTFDAYKHALENHCLPRIGHMALADITPFVVEEMLVQVAAETGSNNVASQVRSALKKVLGKAAKARLLPGGNPVTDDVKVGKRTRNEAGKRWLTREEGVHLLNTAFGTVAYWPLLLGLRFGLRSGESMGLRWEDIDVKNRILHVVRQAQTVKGCSRHLADPKYDSKRKLRIPAKLVAELAAAKARAEAKGVEWVCVDDLGEPLHPGHSSRVIKAAVLAAGFDGADGKGVPTGHDLRSSFLSWLANHANGGAGVKPHVLMAIAGHKSIDVTMAYYVKAEDADLIAAVDSLDFESPEPSKLDNILEDDAA